MGLQERGIKGLDEVVIILTIINTQQKSFQNAVVYI